MKAALSAKKRCPAFDHVSYSCHFTVGPNQPSVSKGRVLLWVYLEPQCSARQQGGQQARVRVTPSLSARAGFLLCASFARGSAQYDRRNPSTLVRHLWDEA